jgi:hypothetical protein
MRSPFKFGRAPRAIFASVIPLCALFCVALVWSSSAFAQRDHVFSSSFGSAGSGDGQFSRPGPIAVNDATGDVYVIDRGNKRVEEFSASGAYLGQFDGSASPTGQFSWPGTGGEEGSGSVEGEIAIDNSTDPLDPSAGDVYVADQGHNVIDKFTATGVYVGQIEGTSLSPFDSVTAIAVDPNGQVWVRATGGYKAIEAYLYEFNDMSANGYMAEIPMRFPPRVSRPYLGFIGLAIDGEGDFYFGQTSDGKTSFVAKFNSAGVDLAEEIGGEEATGMAVDQSSNDVYIDDGNAISAFGPSGGQLERFGAAQMSASDGVGVDSTTGTVYTANATDQTVEAFVAVTVPDVLTGEASSLSETAAIVSGTVNPDGLPVAACEFEYGPTAGYGNSIPCGQSPGSGSSPVGVSVSLSGLTPLTRYHFRLKATNANGSNAGSDRTFLTPAPVTVSEESIFDVSSSGVRVVADIDPGGSNTTFRFEYGLTTAYGQSAPTPEGDLGNAVGAQSATTEIQGLQPGTTYHVRVAATNQLGTVYGQDLTFTTQPVPATGLTLPDGRQWELVSPPAKYGAEIEPIPRNGYVEAAEDGSGITYVASGPTVASSAGNPSPEFNTQILSRRGPSGWASEDIASSNATVISETAGDPSEFPYFTPDLSQALVEPGGNTPLSPEATERTVYVRNNQTGSYMALVYPGNVPAGIKIAEEDSAFSGVHAIDGTPDLTHVIIESELALTNNAVSRAKSSNLYEWSKGHLSLVNVLPDGSSTPEAEGEGVSLGYHSQDIRGALSSDGSRVFWGVEEASNQGHNIALYMSDMSQGKAESVEVSAPEEGVAHSLACARFQIANATGSKVFFLDNQPLTADSKLSPTSFCDQNALGGDLYVYDTETKKLTDLTVDRGGSEPAEAQNMTLGVSEDGSVVYFVATGALAAGAEPGQDNLYVASEVGSGWSSPRLVATLSSQDEPDWGGPGTLQPLNGTPSRVSPNGRFLAFMSDRSLTGYDNRDAVSGQPDEEVYVYDNATQTLRCASCDPSGARPMGIYERRSGEFEGCCEVLSDRQNVWEGHWLAADIEASEATLEKPQAIGYQSRYLTNEGRLFFNSFDALVGQDTNGRADVYEYEPQGLGGCERLSGCVGLISSGTSGEESALLDASGTGPGGEEAEDVFFVTQARLTSQDYDSGFDVYDAHVCSGAAPCLAAPVTPPECTSGDSCKAAPSPQPAIFGPAPSATFAGKGNVTETTKQSAKPRSLTRAQRLEKALRACHREHGGRRSACERQAQKRYGRSHSSRAKAIRKGNR